MSRRGWIYPDRVKAQIRQAVDQATITTAKIKDPCSGRKGRGDYRVKIPPPSGIRHTPEPYQPTSDLTGQPFR
jgi:hypothetical protein